MSLLTDCGVMGKSAAQPASEHTQHPGGGAPVAEGLTAECAGMHAAHVDSVTQTMTAATHGRECQCWSNPPYVSIMAF